MIRWSYVVPRLAVIALCLAAVHYGLPPAVRWTMTYALRASTGAELAIGDTALSFRRGELRLDHLALARSAASDQQIFEADSARLRINLRALAFRKHVIDTAQLSGVRFDTDRIPTTEPVDDRPADGKSDEESSWIVRRGTEMAGALFDRISHNVQNSLEDNYPSIGLSRELAGRWPKKYDAFRERLTVCRQSAGQLQQLLKNRPSFSLSGEQLQQYERHWARVKQLRSDAVQLRSELQQMGRQIQSDQRSVRDALARDQAALRQQLTDVPLDAATLNEYLLDAELRQWWQRMQPWLNAASWITSSPPPNKDTGRGESISFGSGFPGPPLLVRSLQLEGFLTIDGQPMPFSGQASHLAFPPSAGTQPARVHLSAQLPWTGELDAQLDYRGATPRHQLAVHCQDIPVSRRQWGGAQGWHLVVSPGKATVRVHVTTDGQSLKGRMIIEQRPLHLSVADKASVADNTTKSTSDWQQALSTAVAGIDRLQVAVELSGSIKAPRMALQSDLGHKLRPRLTSAMRQVLSQQADRLTAQAEQRVASTLHAMQDDWLQQSEQFVEQLGISDKILQTIANPLASRVQPLGNFLKRF